MIYEEKLVGLHGESAKELSDEFFRRCFERKRQPVDIDHGWITIEFDKKKKRYGYNLLVGRYYLPEDPISEALKKGEGERWRTLNGS